MTDTPKKNRQAGMAKARAAKKTKPKQPKQLTAKQRLFVAEYQIDQNASQAAIRAGYSDNPETCRMEGSRQLKNPLVKAAIEEAERLRVERLGITADRVAAEMGRIAFADLRDVINIKDGAVSVTNTDKLTTEQASALAEISETKDGLRVKMHSKISALEQLGKMLGMFQQDVKVEHSGSVEGGGKQTFEIVIVDSAGQAVTEDGQTEAEQEKG